VEPDQPDTGEGLARRKRAPGEVRKLLLAAARSEFAVNGYSGATTRSISAAADVSEGLLFRHFTTKAQLFREAIVAPFVEFLEDFTDRYVEVGFSSAESALAEYVEGLYQAMRDRRDVMITLIAASAHEPELSETTAPIVQMIDRVEAMTARLAEQFGIEHFDPGIATRAVFAMVTGMALFEPWFYPPGRDRPSQEAVVSEMIEIGLYGVERE
jgi:AcrR family transcriptional regulator